MVGGGGLGGGGDGGGGDGGGGDGGGGLGGGGDGGGDGGGGDGGGLGGALGGSKKPGAWGGRDGGDGGGGGKLGGSKKPGRCGGGGGVAGGGGGLGGCMCRGPQSSQSVPYAHPDAIADDVVGPPSSHTPLPTAHLQWEIGQLGGLWRQVCSHHSTVATPSCEQQPSRSSMHGTYRSHASDRSTWAFGLLHLRAACATGGSTPDGPSHDCEHHIGGGAGGGGDGGGGIGGGDGGGEGGGDGRGDGGGDGPSRGSRARRKLSTATGASRASNSSFSMLAAPTDSYNPFAAASVGA